jgi:hypothetical protein
VQHRQCGDPADATPARRRRQRVRPGTLTDRVLLRNSGVVTKGLCVC